MLLTRSSQQVKSMYDKLIQGTGWSNQIKINACIDDALNILKSPTYLEIFQKPGTFFVRQPKENLI